MTLVAIKVPVSIFPNHCYCCCLAIYAACVVFVVAIYRNLYTILKLNKYYEMTVVSSYYSDGISDIGRRRTVYR